MWATVRRHDNNPELGSDTVTIAVAEDRNGVDRSNELAAEWLREHAAAH